MTRGTFPISFLETISTPFYFYDGALLTRTLSTLLHEVERYDDCHVHYAVKANTHPEVLRRIAARGLGADCVSGGEIQAAVDAGFPADKIVYAGVGKTDNEINMALDYDIACFNVESIPELEVIEQLAALKNRIARVAFRINPNVGAHTHANITTGQRENKFGIDMEDMVSIIQLAQQMPHIDWTGLHFHIGSQILDMSDFAALCERINELQDQLETVGLQPRHINVGGGLGIDYDDPNGHPIPDFEAYFATYGRYLKRRSGQQLHFELGRAVVAQCGSLISRVTYVKRGHYKQFVILDAGMTDLIRPALYGAHHRIENLSSTELEMTYDVVGPVCESSDVFDHDIQLPATQRGDLIAIRSAGAYGEIMASRYNCRAMPLGIVLG